MSFDEREKQQIMLTLDAILASDGFANSSQMQNFLRFIVTKTVEGNTDSIKGYTIGIDALGKPDSFDPGTDPSVRVMAGRLRQAIQNYYHEEGVKDAAIIKLAKGSYVPQIEFPELQEEPAAPLKITADKPSQPQSGFAFSSRFLALASSFLVIALSLAGVYHYITAHSEPPITLPVPERLSEENSRLPVISYSFEYDKNGMPPWITPNLAISRSIVAFSRFDEYRVIPKEDNTSDMLADYHLNLFYSNSVRVNGLDVFVTLYRARSSEILWSNRFTFTQPEPGGDLANLNRIESIVSSILSPYGIIYGDIISRKNPPPRLNCIRQIYEYFARANLQNYANGLDCAEQAVATGNASSSMHAMLSFMKVEAHRRNFKGIAKGALEEARLLAIRAIELKETNSRAYQARFAVEKTSGNQELAIKAAQRAIQLNPFDRDILGDYAAYLTSIGKLEKAREPLRRATDLTPVPPAWLQFYQYLHADLTGDYQIADEILATTTLDEAPLIAVARILAFERSGEEKLLDAGLTGLKRAESSFLKDPERAFLRRGFSKTLAESLAQRIERAKASERYAKLIQE